MSEKDEASVSPAIELLWKECLGHLENEYSEQELNTWIRPLQAEKKDNSLFLLAPNRFVVDWIKQHFFERIQALVREITENNEFLLFIEVGSKQVSLPEEKSVATKPKEKQVEKSVDNYVEKTKNLKYANHLNPAFTFENFVKGKSNEFAYAALSQVSVKPGGSHNPLLIYGDVGVGKTHLMQAAGNRILATHEGKKVIYLHSERFVANMVKALQNDTIEEFKRFYRSVDALLIDDIQFLAGKDRSQEEFFHTFNTLMEERKQIILTCDRYPKEIEGLEERLRSRFGWGLTVAIEPPELETRVAILMCKAEQAQADLPYEVAFFIAKRIRSNVRELEGALKRVVAHAGFTGEKITLDFVKEALRDLLTLQDKLVTIDNIQRTVAEYYKVKVADLMSGRRNRSVVRPRQMAMLLAKELTNHSLPEIGDAFGGKDHTTVLHAYRKMLGLIETNSDMKEDYTNLMRTLST